MRIYLAGAVLSLMQIPGAARAAEDLGYQVQRCLTMPQGTKDSIPLLEVQVDADGAVLDIGTVGEPPLAASRRFAIEAAARAIRRCSPFVVKAAGVYPVTIGGKPGDRIPGGNSLDPFTPIPKANP